MQGLGRIIAGVALLAGAYGAPVFRDRAEAQTAAPSADDTAFAVPRIAPPAGGNVPLPTPLDPSEAAQIKRLFSLQRDRSFAAAAAAETLLDSPLLLGHLRADRLLRQGRGAPPSALRSWLAAYDDHPEAAAVYALLLRLGAAHPGRAPQPLSLAPERPSRADADDLAPAALAASGHPALEARLQTLIRAGKRPAAEALLDASRGLTADQRSLLQARMVRTLLGAGDPSQALALAQLGWRTNARVGELAYLGGLAAWRAGDWEGSLEWFEASAAAPRGSPALAAAAAFWAARAAQRQHHGVAAQRWLHRAAAEPTSFYGLLANRLLGRETGFAWTGAVLGEADVQAIAATAPGARAFALLQVSRNDLAEAEFRLLWPKLVGRPAMQRALLLVCDQAGLTALAGQLASLLPASGGAALASFKVPQLRPSGGFIVDPPLVYALARVESDFRADAVSPKGARGLMQLTATAAELVAARGAASLAVGDQAQNLALGQRYLIYLSHAGSSDLVRLLAAYNAGPTAVSRWSVADAGDPLLYIEQIPEDETRAFVPRALAYSWIYAARFHQRAPGLEQLAADTWPAFTPRTLH